MVGVVSGGRVTWRLAGSVLTVLAIVGLTTQVVGVVAHDESTTVHTFPGAAVDTVEIATDHGSVRVVGDDRSSIRVRVVVSDGLVDTDRRRACRRSTPGARRRMSVAARSGGARADYTVHVPRSVAVVVHNGNGSVSVRGVEGSVDTSS